MIVKRMIVLSVLAFSLSACWLSEEPLFSSDDYATTGIAGEYRQTVFNEQAAKFAKVRFERNDDGSIKITAIADRKRPGFDTKVGEVAFIAIPESPHGWYVAIDIKPNGTAGAGYMIALAKKGMLRVYQPSCRGTGEREGLDLMPTPGSPGSICVFQSREALLSAAKEAVDFLSSNQIIAVTPLIEYRPVQQFLDRPAPDPAPAQ